MLADAADLGDPGTQSGATTPQWDPAFLGDIHGVILVTGECQVTVNDLLNQTVNIFQSTVKEVIRLEGKVRPGDEKGHEQ